jgi:hypothetical protein
MTTVLHCDSVTFSGKFWIATATQARSPLFAPFRDLS